MFFKKSSGKSQKSSGNRDVPKSSSTTFLDERHQEPAEAAPPSQAAVSRVSDTAAAGIVVAHLDDLTSATGRPAIGTMVSGWCAFGPGEGGRSASSLPASENDTFRATASVTLLKAASNGFRTPFFFGPLFLDKEGTVLGWWKPFDMPTNGSTSEIVLEGKAPAGTHSVRLGINGSYHAKGEAGDYVVGVAAAKLDKVVTV